MRGASPSAELGTWVPAGNMKTERFRAPARVLPSGNNLVASGLYAQNAPLASAELYEPTTGIESLAYAELYTSPASPTGPLGNLLANPGFELDANGDTRPDRWTSNPSVTLSEDEAHTGTLSMIHEAELDSTYAVAQRVTSVQPGQPYALQAYIKAPPIDDATGFSLAVQVQWRDAANRVVGTAGPPAVRGATPSGWKKVTAVRAAPLNATAAVVRIVASSVRGPVYIDDVFFGNLLRNAGFETDADGNGKPDGWSAAYAASLRTPAHGGRVALRHQSRHNVTYEMRSTPIPEIVAGAPYRLAGFISIPATTDDFRFDLIVDWKDAVGAQIRATSVATYAAGTAGRWNPFSTPVVAPVGATKAVVRMVVTSLGGAVYVDDLAFTPQ